MTERIGSENNEEKIPVSSNDSCAKRAEKIQNFKLELTLDEELEQIEETAIPITEAIKEEPDSSLLMPKETSPAHAQTNPQGNGCFKKILYAAFVLALSVALAWFAIFFLTDALAFNRSDKPIDVEIPAGSSTQQIAAILQEKGIIEHPICFRVFSKLTRSDGKYQQGAFTLTADMGYSAVVDVLQTMTPRETATVTIPEGYTVDEIAQVLADASVCEKEDFYEAVIRATYEFDFVQAIPTAEDGDQYKGRIYLLEGYLFPDTYDFYLQSSGETVVKRMLENFQNKLTPDMRAAIAAKGLTIDEAINLASIIQGEAASEKDMKGVSAVLFNRLAPGSGYAKLQCDSTGDYVRGILPAIGGIEVSSAAYDTYEREGLPVGPINNPGLAAIEALLNPSTDPAHTQAYFFATDYKTGITYFNKTYAQHEATCRRYKIGMYG